MPVHDTKTGIPRITVSINHIQYKIIIIFDYIIISIRF